MGVQRAGHNLTANAFTSLFNIQFIDDTAIYLSIALGWKLGCFQILMGIWLSIL